jgi:hypothetical protein
MSNHQKEKYGKTLAHFGADLAQYNKNTVERGITP